MTEEQKKWIADISAAAKKAGHIFPLMAACEAALESNYGQSELAKEANNLFGLKLHRHNIYGIEVLPTKEFTESVWVETSAKWEKYDNTEQCFSDRMDTLFRLKLVYPNYLAAMQSKTPEDYIINVSKTWSTDPDRAKKVLDIYREVT